MLKLIPAISLLPLLMLLCGCINIQYEGSSEPPLPDSEAVELYFSADQIPVKDYTVLGAATASAGMTYTATDVEAKLRSFAREKGANGVLIVDIKRIYAGKARADQIKNQSDFQWIVDDSSGSSFRYFREDMLNYSKNEGQEKPVYDILIKAKLISVPRAEP